MNKLDTMLEGLARATGYWSKVKDILYLIDDIENTYDDPETILTLINELKEKIKALLLELFATIDELEQEKEELENELILCEGTTEE